MFYRGQNNSDYNINEENIYFERGLAFLKSQQYKKAINDFEKTNDFSFYKDEGFYNIGEAYLGLKDTINACNNYKKAKELKHKKAKNKIKEICK